ncbi:VIT1/CCC1 transporter family protein [Corynebacterium mendelii]|uniref:VIT1/CCC1 transporter family protein n=1 Tax=Corynebacterium mendelii TaxID=2765362 RepID=A0A939ITV1_9CORY|nr:VIT1/CCC1 transporter family protein [Corynebacterium mendelii]MBN9644239.1 VIT1/CCC1 transporter family protein [Corynebacterium mendelii]
MAKRKKDTATGGDTTLLDTGSETPPSKQQIKRWRRYLAEERAEAAVYRELARKKKGVEREILLNIAAAEARHETYWQHRLGEEIGAPQSPGLKTRMMVFLARHFGSVFTLALLQSAETRTPYEHDTDATGQMAADERIHAEIVRGLAAKGREKMSGNFRAAVFGLNDGLVSNLALVLGVVGATSNNGIIVLTGLSGLLSGALSMGAGEYISVSSQRELLEASTPDPLAAEKLPELDVDANELALVYRARGMDEGEARDKAARVLAGINARQERASDPQRIGDVIGAVEPTDDPEVVGSGWSAAVSSFMFFATGALIPCLPFIVGMASTAAAVAACVLVGVALLCTGAVVGMLSGVSPVKKALIQVSIGLGAAVVTFGLGRALGVSLG